MRYRMIFCRIMSIGRIMYSGRFRGAGGTRAMYGSSRNHGIFIENASHRPMTANMGRQYLILAATFFLAACSDDCVNTEISTIVAPDRKVRAVMFERNCGATTGFTTQIAIVKPGEQLLPSKTVYRADDNHGAAFTGNWGGPWAEMKWADSRHLLIRYAAKSSLYQKQVEADGIEIDYQPVAD